MYKVFVVAVREYRAMVATRAFLVSLIMMPILMLGSFAAMNLLKNAGALEDRKIAVLDPGNGFFPQLAALAEARNAEVRRAHSAPEKNRDENEGLPQVAAGEILILQQQDLGAAQTVDDSLRVDLSGRVRAGELYAVLEFVPTGENGEIAEARFYSQDSTLSDSREWLDSRINEIIKNRKLEQAQIDPRVVALASRPVPVRPMGLLTRTASGEVIPAREDQGMLKIFLPFGAMMLMFMAIFMSSQPMLESVLEEKSQRIAEVLLGSVSTFQLMAGKLLGTIGGSLTVFSIYLAGVLVVAERAPILDSLPLQIVPWFVAFQILGVLFFAAIFMAVGASVNQIKEAQSMLMPVWMMMMLPIFVWLLILRSPNGTLARWLSLFPPATPTTMVMRLATGVSIPLWELLLGLILLMAATVVTVFFAGRIFRAGILWQGKTPRFGELLRWAWSG